MVLVVNGQVAVQGPSLNVQGPAFLPGTECCAKNLQAPFWGRGPCVSVGGVPLQGWLCYRFARKMGETSWRR